jgi:Domain of unknown function (DUF5666)
VKKQPKILCPRDIRGAGSAVIVGLCLIIGGSRLEAQTGSRESTLAISGQIVSVKSEELTVETKSGPVAVKLADKTVIRGELPIKFSEIAPGMYVGATAGKQSDGTFRASRLHVFSEDQRGTGEGHKPLSSAPQSGLTMTNASVQHVEDVAVENVKGRMLTLKFREGEIKVFVPPNIPIVKRVIGDQSWLKPGAVVSVQGIQGADGSLSASQITVRASEP